MTLTRKEILMAFANDQVVQVNIDGVWQDCNIYRYLDLINEREYRIKPTTITVNGVECPTPVQFTGSGGFGVTISSTFEGRKNYLFATEEDAKQVFDALCLPFKGDGK